MKPQNNHTKLPIGYILCPICNRAALWLYEVITHHPNVDGNLVVDMDYELSNIKLDYDSAELRGHIRAVISQEFPEIKIVEDVYPSQLKKTITGSGKAEKIEVARCILGKLGIEYTNLKGKGNKCTFQVGPNKFHDDCSDALGLAYFHYLRSVNA